MSFQKFKSHSYCVGGRRRSSTVKIYGDITSKGSKVLFGFCSECKRKKAMTVSDNTIQAEGLGDFFKNSGKKGHNVSKKLAKNVLKNPTRALDITANIASAAASRSPKNVLSTLPEVINSYRTGNGFYLPRYSPVYSYKSMNNNFNYKYKSNLYYKNGTKSR